MNAYHFITRYSERAEAFVRRSISTLEKIDFTEDFNRETREHYNGLLEAGCDGYAAAEDTMDLEASLATEYFLLCNGMYAAVLMSFYHLWERDMRDLCKRLLRYYQVTSTPGRTVTQDDVQAFNFERLKEFIVSFGVPAGQFEDMNLLRLIVNTAKHSTGPSARELRQLNDRWYCKLSDMCDLELDEFPSDEEMTVSVEGITFEDVKHFGVALNTFWTEAGKHRRFQEMHF